MPEGDHTVEFKFKGVDTLMEKFRQAEKKAPGLGEAVLEKNMRRIKRISKASTPYYEKGKVHIRSKYKIWPLEYYGKTRVIKMSNEAPHFHLIEKGHTMIKPYVKTNYGYKPGVHMVERAVAESERLFYNDLNRIINQILK